MKANELMLGDFVTFKDCQNDKDVVVIKIWEINQDGNAFVFIDDSEVLDEVFIDEDFVGIPLTPEILEKNGAFKNPLMGEQRHFIYNLGGFELLAIYDADFSFQINKGARKIKYVHELQHALKLCGIEKTIEL